MKTHPRRRILVVEDSDEDFDTVRDALERSRLGHILCRAVTGDDCLGILKREMSGVSRPSLVLLDLNLPGIDGRDALSEIKADPELRKLPVVVFSTSSNPRDLEFCYSVGANAYHVKPVRYLDHLDILARVFKYWLDEVILLDDEGNPV